MTWNFRDESDKRHSFDPDLTDGTRSDEDKDPVRAEDPRRELSEEICTVAEEQYESLTLRQDEGTTFSLQEREEINSLLTEHKDIFQKKGEPTKYAEHRIDTGDAAPVSAPPYVMTGRRAKTLRKEIEAMLLLDVIEPCESPWAAPVVLVKKKDSDAVRVCIDYRSLNKITKGDSYPMPRIDSLLHAAKSTKYMSVIDLRSGYWQISVRPEDRDKTAFVTPFGTYRFKVMPFGLKTAPQTFSRTMDRFRRTLPDVTLFSYLDDLILNSSTYERHKSDLERVFMRLGEFGLRANRSKCRFGCDSVEYLGHLLTPDGIKPNPSKISAILERPNPRNPKELLSFVQTASWYRRFIKDFAKIAKPLSDLLKTTAKWKWGQSEQDAYDALKKALTTSPVLQQADETKPFVIKTDASQFALGACLLQGENEKDARPIEYASRLLTPTEQAYSTTDREALAAVWAVEKFRGYIQDNDTTVYTDHQPLKWLLNLKSAEGKLARYNLRLQPFNIRIEYRPGRTNHLADLLSRPINDTHDDNTSETKDVFAVTVDLPQRSIADVRTAQLEDPEVLKIMKAFERAEKDPLEISRWTDRGYLMNKGILYRYYDGEEAQLVTPASMIPEIMQQYHDAPTAGHYGAEKNLSTYCATLLLGRNEEVRN